MLSFQNHYLIWKSHINRLINWTITSTLVGNQLLAYLAYTRFAWCCFAVGFFATYLVLPKSQAKYLACQMTYLRVAIPFFWGGKDNRDLAKDVSVLLGCPQPVFALFLWFLPGICVPRLPCIAAIFAVSCFIYHLAAGFPYTQHICHDIWLPE